MAGRPAGPARGETKPVDSGKRTNNNYWLRFDEKKNDMGEALKTKDVGTFWYILSDQGCQSL